MVVQKPL